VTVASIIIPAYNVSRFIRAAVESALDQTFTDTEILVVDDGSTDDTPAVLQELQRQRQDPRLKIIKKSNGGLSSARNAAIRQAEGRYFGFLDGDDIWCPARLERHLAVFESDPSIGIVSCNAKYISEDDRPLEGRSSWVAKCREPTLRDLIRSNQILPPVVRRACFEEAGLFDESLRSCEDYDMWCRILYATSYRAVIIPEYLLLYRMRHDSLCHLTDHFLDAAEEVMGLMRARMPDIEESVFRGGHAEHYLLSAWKAATARRRIAALRYFLTALRLHPGLVIDAPRRAAATMAAIVMPRGMRLRLQQMLELRRSHA